MLEPNPNGRVEENTALVQRLRDPRCVWSLAAVRVAPYQAPELEDGRAVLGCGHTIRPDAATPAGPIISAGILGSCAVPERPFLDHEIPGVVASKQCIRGLN